MAFPSLAVRSALLFALSAGLTAQEKTPPPAVEVGDGGAGDVGAKPGDAPKTGAPETVVKPQDPEPDPVEQLKKELRKVEEELHFIREVNAEGGLLTRILPRLTDRNLEPRTIDLGITVEAAPAPAPQPVADAGTDAPGGSGRRGARLLGDAEKERLPDDVVFTVSGLPVTQGEFDALYGYYTSFPRTESDEYVKKETVRALIMQKAAAAHFQKNTAAAREKIEEVQRKLADGLEFADAATEYSDCPSASAGGDLGMFPRGQMDAFFERAAFTLDVGQTSDVVQSAFGYHLIKVTGRETDGEGDVERVRASHILVMYDEDATAVRRVMTDAISGNVDVAFIDADWRKLAPPGY